MLIARDELCGLIPQAGAMCLLDGVIAWDRETIACVTNSHRSPHNPLCRAGRLSALHAFEYGAQAVAVHGGLLARAAGDRAEPKYLAALNEGRLYLDDLDTIEQALRVTARLRLSSAGSHIYDTRVWAADRLLAQTRVTVMGSFET